MLDFAKIEGTKNRRALPGERGDDMVSSKYIFALGFFDGVHLGHRALLKTCCALAEQTNSETAAITFEAHPKSLFAGPVPLISTVRDRQRLLHHYGICHIHTYPVTAEVMGMPWEAFLEELLEKGAAGFVCGDDFHFGRKGEGNPQRLAQFCEERGLPCRIVSEQTLDGKRISSTRIRRKIEEGNMESATRLLGHPHTLTGTVIHGKHLGSKLGFPTANLLLPEGTVTPKFGVYACRAIVDGISYPAVTNVGTRPTVAGTGITVEPWILDFEGDLYDREIVLEFYYFLRPEMKFADLSALQQQIFRDRDDTRAYFRNLKEGI